MNKMDIKKRLVMTVTVFTALALSIAMLISYAWFASSSAGLGSLTGVEKPAPFAILGPYGDGGEDIQIDFIGVNASAKDQAAGVNRAQYLFCVQGITSIRRYDIVIAHTTNAGFTYSLFKAGKTSDAVYTQTYEGQSLEQQFYYSDQEIGFVGYNRMAAPNDDLAIIDIDNTYYKQTYKSENGTLDTQYVQKNAMPIYEYASMTFIDDSNYDGKQYYILNVSWNADGENDPFEEILKETDMVYIFVKTVVAGH